MVVVEGHRRDRKLHSAPNFRTTKHISDHMGMNCDPPGSLTSDEFVYISSVVQRQSQHYPYSMCPWETTAPPWALAPLLELLFVEHLCVLGTVRPFTHGGLFSDVPFSVHPAKL